MKRVSNKQLGEIEMTLVERDRQVLETLRLLRYCKTNQLQRLFFYTASTPRAALTAAMKTLTRLKDTGLVDHLERRIGGNGGGTGAYIWFLTNAGVRLLDFEKEKMSSRRNSRKASSEFIRRILLVSEYYVQINEICRMSDKLRIIRLEVDPLCRRTFRLDGKDNVLYPDLYVELQSAKNRERWFIELDLGFTSMNQIVERARQYHQYHRTFLGADENKLFPFVLWIAGNSERRDSMIKAIHDAFGSRWYEKFNLVIAPNQLWTVLTEGPKKEELI